MEYITRRDIYLALFTEYLKARGYKKGTIEKDVAIVKILLKSAGKGEHLTRDDVERIIEEKNASKWYRANLRKSFRKYQAFVEWWENEGARRFREWMERKGYSKWTIKEYAIMLTLPSGRRKGTEWEKKRLKRALSAYQAFLKENNIFV